MPCEMKIKASHCSPLQCLIRLPGQWPWESSACIDDLNNLCPTVWYCSCEDILEAFPQRLWDEVTLISIVLPSGFNFHFLNRYLSYGHVKLQWAAVEYFFFLLFYERCSPHQGSTLFRQPAEMKAKEEKRTSGPSSAKHCVFAQFLFHCHNNDALKSTRRKTYHEPQYDTPQEHKRQSLSR